MEIKDIFSLLLSFACFVLALIIFFRGKRNKANISFGLFALCATIWPLAITMFRLSTTVEVALFWDRIIYLSPIFVAPSFLAFARFFHGRKEYSKILSILIFIVPILILIPILLFTNSWIKEIQLNQEGNKAILGPAYLIWAVWFASYMAWGFMLLFFKYFRTEGVVKAQLRYMLIANMFPVIGSVPFNIVLPAFNNYANSYKYIWIGPFSLTAMIALVAYAMIKYRFMDVRVVVRQVVVYFLAFATILLLVFGAHFLVLLFFIPYIYIELLLAVSLSLILLNPLIKLYLKVVNRYFFTGLHSYQETVRSLTGELPSILDLNILSKVIIKQLVDNLGLDKGVLVIKRRKSENYQIYYNSGFQKKNILLLVDNILLGKKLKEEKKPVIYEELEAQIKQVQDEEQKKELLSLRAVMKIAEIGLLLPLFGKDGLRGIIIFGQKRSSEPYTVQDLNLLQTLSIQASLSIENAQLYDQVQDLNDNLQSKVDTQVSKIKNLLQVREELLTIKENFLHIVSHQLRTPVSIFWGLLDYWKTGSIKELSKNKQQRAKDQVIIAAQRLQNTVNDMLDAMELGRSLEIKFESINIIDVIKEVVSTLKPNYDNKKLYLKIKEEKIPKIQASFQFLKQALMNIVDNAEKYTKKGGTTITIKQLNKQNIIIKIKDTGMGLTTEDKKQIFKTQFFRGTRAQDRVADGSGLGLYIVKQIIDKHKGQIKIDSLGIDKGTTFNIILPIKHEKEKS